MAEPLPYQTKGGLLPGRYSYFSAPPWSSSNVVANPFTSAPSAALAPIPGSRNPGVYTNYPKAPDMEYFTQPDNRRSAEVEPLVSGEQPYQPGNRRAAQVEPLLHSMASLYPGEQEYKFQDPAIDEWTGSKGRGFLFSDPVLKGSGYSPFSDITPQKLAGMAIGSFVPGASNLGIMGSILRNMGAHHEYKGADMSGGGMWDVSPDSNLYVDPETGFAKWDSSSPGGGGTQQGVLNLYNMLQDIGTKDPGYQVETPRGWANARDDGLFTDEPTNFGQQQSGYGNLNNNEAVQSLANQEGTAWNKLSAEIQATGGGYNDQLHGSLAAASNLQDQIDFESGMDLVGQWL